jgi:hypothetical protein
MSESTQSELREELRNASVEPLLPIEKKLIGWSLAIGLVLLPYSRPRIICCDRPRRTNETSPPVAVKQMTVGAVLVPAIHVLAYRGTGGVSAGLGRRHCEERSDEPTQNLPGK